MLTGRKKNKKTKKKKKKKKKKTWLQKKEGTVKIGHDNARPGIYTENIEIK